MDKLKRLKHAIFYQKDIEKCVEECYEEFLEGNTFHEINIFINLLEMIDNKNERIIEILKVMNLIKFPINKSQ